MTNVVMLVEDVESDVELIKRHFENSSISLHCVNTGEDCMRFLRHKDEFAHEPIPDLVLLDLSLPRMDGRSVLRQIRADDDLRYLPVIILTGAAFQEDVMNQYVVGCNAYVIKDTHERDLDKTLRSIVSFWFETAILPRKWS